MILASVGCADQRDSAPFSVRDSAGIEIVENRGAANLLPQAGVSDSTGRALDLGELLYVRHLLPIGDSALLVGGGGQGGLNWVDLGTGAVRLLGRVGPGPGEYAGAAASYRCGQDTIVVQTYPSRLSWLDGAGTFVRQRERPAFRYTTLAVAADCSAALTLSSVRVPSSGPIPEGEIRLTWHDLATDSATVLTSLPMPKPVLVQVGGRELPVRAPYISVPLFAGRGDLAMVGMGERPEVRVYDRVRGLVRIIRWDTPPVPVTAQDAEQYDAILAYRGATYGQEEVMDFPQASAFDLPATKPYYSRLLVADDGRLWVQRYPDVYAQFEQQDGARFGREPAQWWVFEPTGQLLGLFATPRGVYPHAIGGTHLFGIRTDAEDLERVTVLPLTPALRGGHAP